MKKLIVTLVCCVLFAAPSLKAQGSMFRPVNDLHFAYGLVSSNQIATLVSAALIDSFGMGIVEVDEISGVGSLGIGYSKSIRKWLWLGVDALFEQTSITGHAEDGDIINCPLDVVNILATCKMNWFSKSHWAMYSRLAVGAQALLDEGQVSWMPAAQISPVAVEAGGRRLRGYLEAGFGTQGVAIAGLRYRF